MWVGFRKNGTFFWDDDSWDDFLRGDIRDFFFIEKVSEIMLTFSRVIRKCRISHFKLGSTSN